MYLSPASLGKPRRYAGIKSNNFYFFPQLSAIQSWSSWYQCFLFQLLIKMRMKLNLSQGANSVICFSLLMKEKVAYVQL